MPIYSFKCDTCGRQVEEVVSLAKRDEPIPCTEAEDLTTDTQKAEKSNGKKKFLLAAYAEGKFARIYEFGSIEERKGFDDGFSEGASQYGGGSTQCVWIPEQLTDDWKDEWTEHRIAFSDKTLWDDLRERFAEHFLESGGCKGTMRRTGEVEHSHPTKHFWQP